MIICYSICSFDMDLTKQKNHRKLIWRNAIVCNFVVLDVAEIKSYINPVASLCSSAASTWQTQKQRYKFGVNDALLARRKSLN
jgi:hypothetical protein